MGKCILVCAGDLTVGSVPVSDEDYVIAVDGGLMYCESLGLEPDLIIGDFDSLTDSYLDALKLIEEADKDKVIRLSREKDDTDTLAALRLGIEKGYKTFYLYGCGGGRLEHTIANIQCLTFLKDNDCEGYLMEGTGMSFVIRNEAISFKKDMEGFVSIFSLEKEATGVNEKGLKYSLSNAKVTNGFPIGVSNEFIGENAEISVEKGSILVVVNWA